MGMPSHRPRLRWFAHAGAMLVAAGIGAACATPPGGATAPAAAGQPCQDSKTQLEATACWAAAAGQAERALAGDLASAERAVRVRAGDAGARELREVQTQWERYRDAECALRAQRFGGGSAETMAGSACRWRLATERARDLKALSAE